MWFECKVSNWSGQQTAVQRLNNPTVQEKNGAEQPNLRKSASAAHHSTVQINCTAPLRSFTYEASQWSSTVKLHSEAPMWSFTELEPLSEENQKQGIPAAHRSTAGQFAWLAQHNVEARFNSHNSHNYSTPNLIIELAQQLLNYCCEKKNNTMDVEECESKSQPFSQF